MKKVHLLLLGTILLGQLLPLTALAEETISEEVQNQSTSNSLFDETGSEVYADLDDILTEETSDHSSEETQSSGAVTVSIADWRKESRQHSLALLRNDASVTKAFIAKIAPEAQRIAKEYQLYPSILLAHAAIESSWGTGELAIEPLNNYFFTEGIGEEGDVAKELLNQEEEPVEAVTFKKYASFIQSLDERANYLSNQARYSAQPNEDYSNSIQQVSETIGEEPDYENQLTQVIEAMNLTQFDQPKKSEPINSRRYDAIVEQKSIANLEARITTATGSHGLYNGIFNTNSDVYRIGSNSNYVNQLAIISEEAQTTRATYVKFSIAGKEIGWMDKRAFVYYDEIVKQQPLDNIEARIVTTNGNHGLYNGPYNTSSKVKRLGSNKNYTNKIARVTEETQTIRATYVKFSIDGKEIGWMDKRAFVYYDEIVKQQPLANLEARIVTTNGNHGLYNGPYNTSSKVKRLGSNKNYANKIARVTEEVQTTRATYVKFSVTGKEIGWMDKRAFNFDLYDTIVYEKQIANVDALIVTNKGSHGLYNGIYNTSGTVRRIGSNMNYANKVAVITAEAKTTRATYVKFSIAGKEIGWMDKRSFNYDFYDKITYQKAINNLEAKITTARGNHGLYNGIYNTSKSVRWIGSNKDYTNKVATITAEAKTNRSTYVKFSIAGQEIGWMDKRSFDYYDEIISRKKVNNEKKVITTGTGRHGIYNGVFNTSSTVKWVGYNTEYNGKEAVIIEEAKTSRATYLRFKVGNKEIGWMDAKAFSNEVEKLKKVQQLLNRKYNNNDWSIHVESTSSTLSAGIRNTRQMTAASTGKLPAIYYTQKRFNEKSLAPGAQFVYSDQINQMTNAYGRGGAGILQGQPFGKKFTIDTILNWTIRYSDNQGANFLGYYAANRYDNQFKKEISSIIGRSWTTPFSVSAKENAKLMKAVYGQGGQANKYLQNTVYDKERIPKYLPVKVGHKIGDVYDYRHDVAIVYSKEPYILSVMTQNYKSYEQISILSKEIYDIMK